MTAKGQGLVLELALALGPLIREQMTKPPNRWLGGRGAGEKTRREPKTKAAVGLTLGAWLALRLALAQETVHIQRC
jgi:hypothetical protein